VLEKKEVAWGGRWKDEVWWRWLARETSIERRKQLKSWGKLNSEANCRCLKLKACGCRGSCLAQWQVGGVRLKLGPGAPKGRKLRYSQHSVALFYYRNLPAKVTQQ
jgi:hypothetical protein